MEDELIFHVATYVLKRVVALRHLNSDFFLPLLSGVCILLLIFRELDIGWRKDIFCLLPLSFAL